MTEEEIHAAVAVNNQRNEEYRQAGILPPQSELPLDLTAEEVMAELVGREGLTYGAISTTETEAYDIEGAPIKGRTAQPTAAVVRADTEMVMVNNPSATQTSGTKSDTRTDHTAPTTPSPPNAVNPPDVMKSSTASTPASVTSEPVKEEPKLSERDGQVRDGGENV